MSPDTFLLVELGISPRFVRNHAWVVNAITGFLSAYYLEDPRFRLHRRYEDLETGMHIWVCKVEETMPVARMVKRLLLDLPAGQMRQLEATGDNPSRYVIDLAG
jgi:hypothetical protein